MTRTSHSGGSGSRPGIREKRIDVRFADPAAFRSALLDVEPGGLFVAGRYDVQVGDPVTIHCVFPGVPDGVAVRARVLWRRLAGGRGPAMAPGLGLMIRPPSMATFRRLIEFAEGRAPLPGRKEERFPTKIGVRCEFGERDVVSVAGEMTDISVQGAALKMPHRPSVGDKLYLHVRDPRGRECDLEGFVRWIRPGGDGSATAALVGVEVQFPRRADLESWERLVARAKAEVRLSTEFSSD